MDLEMKLIEVSYTQYEMASVIEGIHDSLFRQVRWTISPAHENWKALDFEIVKSSIDALSTAYGQSYMAFRQSVDKDEGEAISEDYEKAFIIPDPVWDVVDQIRSCETWEEVEQHRHADSLCQACRLLSRVPKA